MNLNQAELERKSGIPPHPQRAAGIASVLAGGLAGAAIGIFAFGGPVTILIGAVAGGLAGGVIDQLVRTRSKRQQARDDVLDREIGVIGGDIGAGPRRPRSVTP